MEGMKVPLGRGRWEVTGEVNEVSVMFLGTSSQCGRPCLLGKTSIRGYCHLAQSASLGVSLNFEGRRFH